MAASFIDALPDELIAHVTAGCGKPGVRWIEDLESRVRRLEAQWSLVVDEPFAGGEFNFVAPATRHDGTPTVLKIAPPWTPVEIFGEAEYLRSRNGHGCVRLYDVEPECRAILIERVFPGATLSEEFRSRKSEALAPAIEVMQTVLRPVPRDAEAVTTLNRWFDGLRRFRDTDFPQGYAARALSIYDRLSKQPGRTYYLHGDYHPGNLVTAERSRYLAIDPKGIIGHMGYEIAVFLNNFHWWQEHEPGIETILASAVSHFSSAFEIDEIELREWAYAQMVLGSWWNYVDMPNLYDGGVVKADVWRV